MVYGHASWGLRGSSIVQTLYDIEIVLDFISRSFPRTPVSGSFEGEIRKNLSWGSFP